MRMLAARSEWDMKMAAVAAGLVTAVVLWFNVTIGLLGKAIFPDLPDVDQVFPKLVNEYLGPGLLGIVVAGLLAGGISTYDSISSALSAVFTRDLYARFLVKDRDDRHYLFVSRLVTFVVIAVSFVYVPLIQGEGMVAFYLALTPVAVIPLFAVYLMGTLTRVNRVSGTVGLVTGMVCGLGLFAGDRLGWDLPIWLTSVWWRYLWGIALPALAMVGTSVLFGWASREEIEGLFQTAGRGPASPGPPPHPLPARATGSNWLDTTHAEVPKMPRYPFAVPAAGLPWHKKPHLWAVLLVAALAYLNLWVLW
jgi:SSS family solute:Na+ symporter